MESTSPPPYLVPPGPPSPPDSAAPAVPPVEDPHAALFQQAVQLVTAMRRELAKVFIGQSHALVSFISGESNKGLSFRHAGGVVAGVAAVASFSVTGPILLDGFTLANLKNGVIP